MEYTTARHDSGVLEVSFRGRITFGQETERCREDIKAALSHGDRAFLFDLSAVEYVDSAGLGFLVSCLTSLRQAGAELRLSSPPARVKRVMHLTRLDTVFQIFPSPEAALAGFGRTPAGSGRTAT
jgi:anti-sigma B factor antagonist